MRKNNNKSQQEVIVKAENLGKVYDKGKENEIWAIKDIDLEIKKGEFISIMGPSGSGKTTLLNCLSGIDDISKGEVYVAGQNLCKMKDRPKTKYRAAKMGFIFQTFNLIPVLNALENVEMPLLVNGASPSYAREQATEMLERVGLKDRLKHKPAELSGGQRQRVTVARALVHNPAVVWADEPTGNLDSNTAEEILKLMHRLNKELNETFVIVTHDRNVADSTQRIIEIEDGKIK